MTLTFSVSSFFPFLNALVLGSTCCLDTLNFPSSSKLISLARTLSSEAHLNTMFAFIFCTTAFALLHCLCTHVFSFGSKMEDGVAASIHQVGGTQSTQYLAARYAFYFVYMMGNGTFFSHLRFKMPNVIKRRPFPFLSIYSERIIYRHQTSAGQKLRHK